MFDDFDMNVNVEETFDYTIWQENDSLDNKDNGFME